MSEPVNSVTMKVLQPLWNQSSPRTNNCLAYSDYLYPGIEVKKKNSKKKLALRKYSIPVTRKELSKNNQVSHFVHRWYQGLTERETY